jgi:hypothetical protein
VKAKRRHWRMALCTAAGYRLTIDREGGDKHKRYLQRNLFAYHQAVTPAKEVRQST